MNGEAPSWKFRPKPSGSAGVSGAFLAGEPALVEWLMQRARTYMFATAAPAMIAEALRAGLALLRSEDQRRVHLRALIERLRQGVRTARLPWSLMDSDTAIQPLVIGSNADALAVMAAVDAQGVWVPAIRPPTVPEGTARLRISLSAAHTLAQVDRLCQALAHAAA